MATGLPSSSTPRGSDQQRYTILDTQASGTIQEAHEVHKGASSTRTDGENAGPIRGANLPDAGVLQVPNAAGPRRAQDSPRSFGARSNRLKENLKRKLGHKPKTSDELGLTNSLDVRDAIPEPETWIESLYRRGAETVENLISRVNNLITSPAPETQLVRGPREYVAPATPASVTDAFMKLVADRREAESQAVLPGSEQATPKISTRITAVDESAYQISRAARFRALAEDQTAPFKEFVARYEGVAGTASDTPLINALVRSDGERNVVQSRLMKSVIEPVDNWIRKTAKAKGVSINRVHEMGNYVATLKHLITEGHAAFRQGAVNDIEKCRYSFRRSP
ncbi:MAG: hypothetical protein LBE38_12005 [Deltaproteobacteria bacterium]|nr:hypothetical protein [Deltaproteobacteria bacterium]